MNFIMANKEVLEVDYKIPTSGERQLLNGQYIIHFETTDPHWVTMKDDNRITYWTQEALLTYLEFVLGE